MKVAMIARVAIFMMPKRYIINAFNLEDQSIINFWRPV